MTNVAGANGSVVPLFAELSESAATGRLAAVYDDVRSVLRVPFVDQLWRVLALFPDFLLPVWDWLAPVLGSTATERAGDDLRRGAVITLALGLPSHKAFRGDLSRAEIGPDDRERISNYNMAEHYVLPKVLLAAEMILAELKTGSAQTLFRDVPLEPLPRGVAEGVPRVGPMDPQDARGEIGPLFAEIRQLHGYPALSDYFRTIARAGDFLRVAINPLRPIIGDPEYFARARTLVQRAAQLAVEIRRSAGGELAPLVAEVPRQAVEALTFYRNRLLPETLVELSIIKGLTDGPQDVTKNRYSLTEAARMDGPDE